MSGPDRDAREPAAGEAMSGADRDVQEPAGGLPRIIFKLRTEGPRWIAKRLAAEAVHPTTGPGQVIRLPHTRT